MARQASGDEAVPPATGDPLSAGRLEKYTVPDFMLLLALTFGKCQNQMPTHRSPRQAMPRNARPGRHIDWCQSHLIEVLPTASRN